MNVICVDDEPLILQHTVSLCRELPRVDETKGFTQAADALAWLEEHPASLAILDIEMPDMNGLLLAAKIKKLRPDTAILFLTGYPQYAVEAFSLHADGYLLKPVAPERLARELQYILSRQAVRTPAHIFAQTFGGFDLFVGGESVSFRRARAKEILACLIDRQGSSLSRAELFSILYGDMAYTPSMQKQLDVMIRSLRGTLREHGISEILEMKRGLLRIRPETFDCDLYQFLKGNPQVINAYRGIYMNAYSWASMTEAFLTAQREAD